MTISKLVISNIVRRRGRFVFTLLGITIGIASYVTFLTMGGSLKSEINRETAALGANLIVIPKGSCGYEQLSILTGDQMPTNITSDEVASIEAIESDVLEDIPEEWDDVASEAGRGAGPSWEFSEQELELLDSCSQSIRQEARTDCPEIVVRESSWCVQVTLRDSDSIFTSSAIYFTED